MILNCNVFVIKIYLNNDIIFKGFLKEINMLNLFSKCHI